MVSIVLRLQNRVVSDIPETFLSPVEFICGSDTLDDDLELLNGAVVFGRLPIMKEAELARSLVAAADQIPAKLRYVTDPRLRIMWRMIPQ